MFFWLLIAVTAPFLPLIDPNKPIAPFTLPLTEKNDVFFWLGADFKGRDMLSRTLWGCQRVIVWGVTATLVAYVVGTLFGLLAGYLVRLVGRGHLVLRQRAAVVPGDGAVHRDPELSRARAASTS